MGALIQTDFLDLFKNDWFLLSDFTDFFCGGIIGQGTSRSVYEYRMDSRLVLKIDSSGQFNNVAEWDIYHNLKSTPYGKFLAPCVHISSCGRVLLQRKTKPVQLTDLPKDIPSFMSDSKLQNWGRIGKNIVCHDYANHSFYNPDSLSMVPALWWSDSFQVIDGNVN